MPTRPRLLTIAVSLAASIGLIAAGPAMSASAATSPYLSYQQGDPSKPIQWLDCKPIQYRINTAHMPSGMTRVVKRVFAIIHQQTGGVFHYAGHTTHRFGSESHSATRPTIYISFTRSHYAGGHYLSQPGTVGWGGPRPVAWSGLTATGATWRLAAETYGELVLYAPAHLKRYGGGRSWQALILHEVGHTLDLAHRTSTRDVMYPALRADGPGTFSRTEVKRLRAVLKRTGCDYAHLPLLSPRPGGGAYDVPSVPTRASASAPSSTRATIRWSAPTSTGGTPVIAYRVARGGDANGGGAWAGYIPASARSFTFTKLTPNTRYHIQVQAVNALGIGSWTRFLVTVPPAG
jgi:hypothetical protein